MIKLLVVDDEKNIVELLDMNFTRMGYRVIKGYTGMEAITLTNSSKPDLILLDLMLPDTSGIEVCSILRNNDKTKHIPIIMLTARSEEEDKVQGLLVGADDYMTKPFSIKELDARIKTVLRRSALINIKGQSDDSLAFKDLMINKEDYTIEKNGISIDFTLSEFRIMLMFIENPNKIFDRQSILYHISSDKDNTDARTVDVHIRNIRKKLDDKEEKYIKTVRGLGYKRA